MLWKVWRAALCVCFLTAVVTKPAASAELSRVAIERVGDHDVVLVHVTEEVGLNVFFLVDPHRLVADFGPLNLAKAVQGFDGSGQLVSRIRHGVQPDLSLRLVFGLFRSATVDVQFEKRAVGGVYRIALRPTGALMEPPDTERATAVIERTMPVPIVVEDDETPKPEAESPEIPPVIDRRSAAEAEAEALITRQREALERADSTKRKGEDTASAPELPGPAWNAPLAPPWE